MNLLLTLLVGVIVGWLVVTAGDRPDKAVPSVVIGIVGALVANILFFLLTSAESYMIFSWAALFWSLAGALIFAGLANLLDVYPNHEV